MKTALIFGHTSGMGFAITKILLEKNYSVIGFARSQSSMQSDRLENIQVDLTVKEEVEKTSMLIKRKFDKFDVLIYCSGVLTAHTTDNLDYQETERLYKILVFAPMIIESHLLPLIKKNKADVVNITSEALIHFYPSFAEYSSAKAAISNFIKHLQTVLDQTGSRVIEFCPGAFQSNIYKNMTGEKMKRDEGKYLSADAYAKIIAYLLDLPKNIKVPYIYVDNNTNS